MPLRDLLNGGFRWDVVNTRKGNFDEGWYQRALAINERGLGPEHPDTTIVRTNYINLLRHRSREVAPSLSLGQRIRAWLSRK